MAERPRLRASAGIAAIVIACAIILAGCAVAPSSPPPADPSTDSAGEPIVSGS